MTSDFRTQGQERKWAQRLSYLEELVQSDCFGGAREKSTIEAEIEALRVQLEDLRRSSMATQPIGLGESLPFPPVHVELEAPEPSLSEATLSRWRLEAKERQLANGEHDDEPRRILLLIDLVRHLRAQ